MYAGRRRTDGQTRVCMMMQRRVTKARTTCKCIYAANAPLNLPEEDFLPLELPREVVEVEEVQHRWLGGHLVMFGVVVGGVGVVVCVRTTVRCPPAPTGY